MSSFLTDAMPLTPSWWDIGARIILTLIAGGLIGLDRERGGHAAGFRTTILVALAACVAMIQANLLLSIYGSFTQMDVLRFPLGVLTGVGFIGGGAILKRGDMLTGVTTAATLWFMTVVGLCFGGGQILTGIAATAVGFTVLSPLKRLDTWLRCEQKAALVVRASNGNIPDLSAVLNPLGCHAGFLSLHRTADSAEVTFELRWLAKDPDMSARAILSALSNTHDVADFSMKSTTT
ncbi:MgtC/SapB family protein [Rhizobium leguminosarum]|uniref:MgtC/SapB family protein n=1 Tax=Rhizobium leguminosarum TaxID=384 RepID=UPI00144223FD|nr:MgtC/SapB family protein [Rhizobium leguminosarum]MBY5840675.1 MgtC/SapB family protein [Rhizobium leguminosarum]NKM80085.1 MgtC/SapB family protein [Rhizobium leguminosarum bv. viciae]QSZ06174.1 MgtC/SapB family protein [Rhizobium leguminosarum]